MKKALTSNKGLWPYLYTAPALIFMFAIIVYPMFSSLYISFHHWSGLGPLVPAGLDNYTKLFFSDANFGASLAATFIWVLLSITVLTATSLALALVVEFGVAKKGMIAVTRTVLFMPMMMSMVAVGLLWSLILNPLLGLLTRVLDFVGLINQGNPPDLLGDSSTAIFAVFLSAIWQWSGFGMVIFSSAIQGIPEEILEASTIDGCSRAGQIRHIVLPLLWPAIAILTTVNCVGAFKAFDILYVMTAGGPGNATMVTTIYMFRQAFVDTSFGYSAAISVVMFVVAAVFGFFCMKLSEKAEYHF